MRFLLFTNTTCTMRRPGTVAQNAPIPVLFTFKYLGVKWAFLERKDIGICSSGRDRSEEPSRQGTIGSTGYIYLISSSTLVVETGPLRDLVTTPLDTTNPFFPFLLILLFLHLGSHGLFPACLFFFFSMRGQMSGWEEFGAGN
jgi:hypothetical protein